MRSFLLHRFTQMLLVLLAVSIFAFCIVYFAPGDPLYLYTSPAVSSYKMTDAQLDEMRASLGLTGNVFERYISWASKLLQGDWGLSVSNHLSVLGQILAKLPNTLGLMGSALVLSVLFSIPLGLLAGYYKNKWVDKLISLLTYVGVSLPSFWFGIMMIVLFSLTLGLFPSSGMHTIGKTDLADAIWHGTLPALVLSANNLAVFVRYIRSNTIVVLQEDHITTAISKGLPRWQIMRDHVLKNCLLPVITIIGMNFGTLVTGSFIIESVFGWPGLGTLFMDSINNLDYTMVMGIVMIACVMLLIGNFLADIAYGFADPRIKAAKGGHRG